MTTNIGQIITQESETWKSSTEVLPLELPANLTKKQNDDCFISLYNGEAASPKEIAVSLGRLMMAFPKMSNGFFDLLAERIAANKFTSRRLYDAINSLIDNFNYKELNIADIIKFDKKVKLYSYNEVCRMVSKGEVSFSDFEIREINGECYRVKKTDLIS